MNSELTPTGDNGRYAKIASEMLRISPDVVVSMGDDGCIWIRSRITKDAVPIEREELPWLIARLTEIANREDEQMTTE
jgi:hypothetical protein